VRNYQARNFMRDMKQGDRVLFYHSGADPPAVAGSAVVAREAYPDHTAWDPRDEHYDPKASPENPIWRMVDIELVAIFPVPVPIGTLRAASALREMELLRTGSRLSVQPVKPGEFAVVLQLARAAAAGETASKKRPAARQRSRTARRSTTRR
jgi:predicted RNA-binding protein with PUA-like domain